MAQKKIASVFFSETTFTRGEYSFTRITVRTGNEKTLDALIADCVDNRAGYSSQETADSQQRRYQWLRDQGYIGVWESRYDGTYVDLEWQHYKSSYGAPDSFCEMTVAGLPRHVAEVRAAVKLIDRLFAAGGKLGHDSYVMKDDPKYLRDVLARMNAKPLVSVEIPPSVTGTSWGASESCTTRTLASVSALKAA